MRLSGWGRYPVLDCRVHRPRDAEALRALLAAGPVIPRGNGRAYGDSALNPAGTVEMGRFNRLIAFDPATGQLVAEAGVLLAEVIAAFLPRGWFPAVTPGTKFVTLGGMIAADVHGKNHHCDGSFGRFVDWIDLLGADGRLHRCSRRENPERFALTVGGMGLTGVILRAAIRLRRVETGWIRQTTIPVGNLAAMMATFEAHAGAPYSVAWIDCLATGAAAGRGLVMLGAHAPRAALPEARRAAPLAVPPRRPRRVPIDAPPGLLNRLTLQALNSLYWRLGRARAGTRLVDWDSYFYPLDALLDWNRLYGPRGFAQFQCVLPPATARAGLSALLGAVARAGQGSFLAVLKRLGPAEGRLSFPMEGYTLALDFPVHAANLALLERLDRITLDHGGRFYLAKDARMSAETLHRSDARAAAFAAARRGLGAAPGFASAQSERLGL